jgi:uncharacterized protein YrrD
MSIKANSLINLPVITVEDGKNINTIKDIVYDGITNKVTAFVVDEKGWFNTAKIILMQDIQSIGKDAILIQNESKIVTADSQVDKSVALTANNDNFLDTNEVITQSGTKLGQVTDIYFNEITGKLEAIEVSEGFLKKIVSGTKKIVLDDIITIGKENLIVEDIVEENIEIQSQHQGINKVAQDIKTTSVSMVSQASDRMQEATEVVKEKTQEVLGREAVQNAVHKTQAVAGSVKEKTTEIYQDAKDNIESGQAEASLKNSFGIAKDRLTEISVTAKEKTADTMSLAKDNLTDRRIQSTLGKPIAQPAVYSQDQEIIAVKGDIVTPDLVELAKSKDSLNNLLNGV